MLTKTATIKGVQVLIAVLTENDNFVLANYGILSHKEICEILGIQMKDYRGITSKLSKAHLIETPNTKKKREAKELLQKSKVNKYTNYDGVNKQIGRELIIEEIDNSNIIGNVLGLPFKTLEFEKQLLNKVSNDFTFVGCEEKLETYHEMLKTVIDDKIKMSCYYGKLVEVLEQNKKATKYAHIFADYCGQVDTYVKDIKLILKHKMVQVGGIVAFTFANRDSSKGTIVNDMNELNPIDAIEGNVVESAIKTFLLKEAKNNFALIKTFSYKDEGKQSMVLYILKRIK